MHVEALYVHPVKSAAGIRLEQAELDGRGIRWDRRWMVVDADGLFVTQRNHPRLALVRTALAPGELRLEAEGLGSLAVPYEPPAGSERMRVRVWDDECEALRVGGAVGEWLGALLGVEVSLVFMPEDTVRPVDEGYAPPGRRVGFADAFPLLVVGRASFEDLQARVSEPLVIERFRPNVVVTGAEAYAEDTWSRVRVGEVPLRIVKPCTRCAITTVDPETATRGKEPLRTLATYRRQSGGVVFGQNALHEAHGTVRVGDPVVLLDAR